LHDCNIVLPTAAEPWTYYADKIYERYAKTRLIKILNDNEVGLKENPVQTVQDMISDLNKIIMANPEFGMVDLFNTESDVLGQFWSQRKGEDNAGILYGWPTLDEMSGGMQPADFITINGRAASGKTMLNLFIALTAWVKYRVPVLFVSMEMVVLPLAQRLIAMMTKSMTYVDVIPLTLMV